MGSVQGEYILLLSLFFSFSNIDFLATGFCILEALPAKKGHKQITT